MKISNYNPKFRYPCFFTRDFEGFGYSLAEAMAYSVPIISTNVGGSKEFLIKRMPIL